MARNVTVTFGDGSTHVYQNAPDDVTPELIQARAEKDFGKTVSALDGGRKQQEPVPKTAEEDVKDVLGLSSTSAQRGKNLLAGMVRGAGSIGATLLTPYDLLAGNTTSIKNPERRAGMDEALKTLGADVDSTAFGIGKVGSEIAGTAGVGGVLAKPIQTVMPNLASAISQAGMASNVGRGTNMAGGALAGAASSGMVNPDAGEMGLGAVLGGTLPDALRFGSKVISGIGNIPQNSILRAKKMLEEALGADKDAAKRVFAQAPSGIDAGQALAESGMNKPVFQAMAERGRGRLSSVQEATDLAKAQDLQRQMQLQGIAGGESQTAARASREEAVKELSATTEPVKQDILGQADAVTKAMTGYSDDALRNADLASKQVEDVRRFTAAGERASDRANSTFPVEGMPRISGRYTYMGDLAKRADDVASLSASNSLSSGDASRFAQTMLDSLTEAGMKPLKAEPLIQKITEKLGNAENAGNEFVAKYPSILRDQLAKWTYPDGTINPVAIDAIRKNSVNAAIDMLYPTADASVKQKVAAGVMGDLKKAITDAVESAGGKGYKQYLDEYAKARQVINQQKLGADALALYKENPKEFIRLVEGDTPERVEKIFGAGNYDIAKEMSRDALEKLGKVSDELKRDAEMAVQSTKGRNALEQLIEGNLPRFRLPMWFNWKATVGNKLLDVLEEKVGTKTMDALAKALESGRGADELLSTIPTMDRIRVINILSKPEKWGSIPTEVKQLVSTSLTAGFAKNRKQE